MDNRIVLEIMKKENRALKDFLKILQGERDAIISFSLEGIIQENNRKEELIRRLEYLKAEKEKAAAAADQENFTQNDAWRSLSRDIERTMEEVRAAMEKNMHLLSFSIDHVRSSIEHIVGFINGAGYGRKREQAPLFVSKVF
jgi:benzoyl-CoA reductase/2-hydroxyglutaryl-CoA dehydratase subunit BcrC/BadD/HgdB